MAVEEHKLKNSMILEYCIGSDDEGKSIMKRQRFSNVKLDALDEDISEVSDALSPLMEFGITNLKKQVDSLIVK